MVFLQLKNALEDAEFCDKLDGADFEWCYANLGLTAIPSFSKLLLDDGINPLDYMDKVPVFFLRGTDITEFTIREGIYTIESQAFCVCGRLREMIIPSSVTRIEHHAFLSCQNMEAIFILKSVKDIGAHTFDGCYNLTIYCEADEADVDFLHNWKGTATHVKWNSTLQDFKERR